MTQKLWHSGSVIYRHLFDIIDLRKIELWPWPVKYDLETFDGSASYRHQVLRHLCYVDTLIYWYLIYEI